MLYGTKLRDNDYRLKAFRFIRRDVSNGYSYNIKLRIGFDEGVNWLTLLK